MTRYSHYTVGHSSHTTAHFLQILTVNNVSAVADVRSVPASRYNPQFNRDPLKASLAKAGIKYVFLGKELGARRDDPDCYADGRVKYERIAQTDAFRQGLQRLLDGAANETIAVACAEGDPLDCHRTLLVARQLEARGGTVGHILPDGSVESHQDALLRLRSIYGLAEPDLLHTSSELLEVALARHESRIAYVDDGSAAEVGHE